MQAGYHFARALRHPDFETDALSDAQISSFVRDMYPSHAVTCFDFTGGVCVAPSAGFVLWTDRTFTLGTTTDFGDTNLLDGSWLYVSRSHDQATFSGAIRRPLNVVIGCHAGSSAIPMASPNSAAGQSWTLLGTSNIGNLAEHSAAYYISSLEPAVSRKRRLVRVSAVSFTPGRSCRAMEATDESATTCEL